MGKDRTTYRIFYVYLLLLAMVYSMGSCRSPQKLYQQGVNKIKKAISKDSTLAFPTDTIKTLRIDTIPGIDGKDSIIIKTNTIQLPCDFDVEAFELKTRRQLRSERKSAKNQMKHLERMYRLKTKRLDDSLSYLNKLNRELTKQLDDQTDADVKLAKEETKQKKGNWFTRLLGRFWWLVLIIGFAGGIYLDNIIPKIKR
jgi:hypothetical protein